MGYKKYTAPGRKLVELTGNEITTDSRGIEWGIRSFTFDKRHLFERAFQELWENFGDMRGQARFLYRTLRPVEYAVWHTVREWFGLPPFTFRSVYRRILPKDFDGLFKAVFETNQNMTFDKYLEQLKMDMEAIEKGEKKTNLTSENSTIS